MCFKSLWLTLLLPFSFSSLNAQRTGSSSSGWSGSGAAYYFYVPNDRSSLSLVAKENSRRLHLEERWNYETQNTFSAYAGWRFGVGNALRIEAIPMIGILIGRTDGIGLGFELEANYKKFSYSSETTYVIDFAGSENNFVYTWGEIGYRPIQKLQVGVSYQRTLIYQTDMDVQVGAMAKILIWRLEAGVYYFNPFTDNNLYVFSLSMDF